jgi:hypothetical protein
MNKFSTKVTSFSSISDASAVFPSIPALQVLVIVTTERETMRSKIGLIFVLTAGFVVAVLTTAPYASPLVRRELTRMYPVKADPRAVARRAGIVPDMTGERICTLIVENTPGSCIPNADLDGGLKTHEVDKMISTVAVLNVTIDFPAWMSADDIDQAIRKNLPADMKYDIRHNVPNGE